MLSYPSAAEALAVLPDVLAYARNPVGPVNHVVRCGWVVEGAALSYMVPDGAGVTATNAFPSAPVPTTKKKRIEFLESCVEHGKTKQAEKVPWATLWAVIQAILAGLLNQ